MNIDTDETELLGEWIFDGQRMRGDATCERIKHLTRSVLRKLGTAKDSGGWETLYQDPEDERLWEHTYPQGHLQGGGPPKLAVISVEDAQRKYGVELVESVQPDTPGPDEPPT